MAKNYAFIDSQNVHQSIRSQGWMIDWHKFRVYLREKYDVERAFMFMGYVKSNKGLYDVLRRHGYVLIFKPTFSIQDGDKRMIKGNVDAELVLHTMIEYPHYNQAIIVSGDGDFYCLVEYLLKQNKLKRLIVPNLHKYSWLLRRFSFCTNYLNRLQTKIGNTKLRGIS